MSCTYLCLSSPLNQPIFLEINIPFPYGACMNKYGNIRRKWAHAVWYAERIGVIRKQVSWLYGMFDTEWRWSAGVCSTWWRHQTETLSEFLALCEGNHRSSVNSPHKGQRRRALMFSLTSAWTTVQQTIETPDNLSLHCAHYDITVMIHQAICTQFAHRCVLLYLITSRVHPYHSGLLHRNRDNHLQDVNHLICSSFKTHKQGFIAYYAFCIQLSLVRIVA